MPLSITRFNAQPSHHPNHLITFVKPLPGPDSSVADTYLHAIAAICLPIMKKHHLSVTTLEEHEPNREFIGRNFNNGEIIQLVLKNRGGGWMPFRHVQMVMMHELAHNVQMNHGKNFWIERNKFASDLKELWVKGYTGDGFWGQGRTTDLETIEANATLPTGDQAPASLCGGTYRSRRRKRKRGNDGQELTWKEKRDRRIEKKFGKNGQKLGEDDGARMMLEIGKTVGSGKPRVANSKRGRELRAAAALARFGQQPNEDVEKQEDGSDFESDEDDPTVKGEDARDANGQRLLDSMGFGMVKVCEDEDADDVQVKREMAELDALGDDEPSHESAPSSSSSRSHQTPHPTAPAAPKSLYDIPQHPPSPPPRSKPKQSPSYSKTTQAEPSTTRSIQAPTSSMSPRPKEITCPICTLNLPASSSFTTCPSCSHVLDCRRDPRSWLCKCSSSTPKDSTRYVNAGDVRMCGLCGSTRTEGEDVGDHGSEANGGGI